MAALPLGLIIPLFLYAEGDISLKKNILLIHTGGTISMELNTDTGGVIVSAANPLAMEIGKIQQFARITEIEAFNIPSPHITAEHMLELKEINRQTDYNGEFHGIVITHGTDTLEETAYFLELATDYDIPIVLTGAMRSSNEIGSDGVYNLMSAVRVAANENAHGKGVLVVLNDEIHTATNVTKTTCSNVSTFQSPQYGPIGIVTKSGIHFHHAPLSRSIFLSIRSIKKSRCLKSMKVWNLTCFNALLHWAMTVLFLKDLGKGTSLLLYFQESVIC